MSIRRVTLGVLTCALVFAPASVAGAQTYEPNDSYITGFGPLTAGTDYSAATETENDEDFYFFYLPERTQMFFSLTATHTEFGFVCAKVVRQTLRRYSEVDDVYLGVAEGKTQTAAVTLDRGKYFFWVTDNCSEAGETYTFRIGPAGSTSSYEPFAAACSTAHAPVVEASAALRRARAMLTRAKAKLAKARARGANRGKLRRRKARVKAARGALRASRVEYRTATAIEARACSVPR